ncbi:MAG: class I SAM-dependent methyltransferase, partial [Promethearchaeota archaeon]
MEKTETEIEKYWDERYKKLGRVKFKPSKLLEVNYHLLPKGGMALVLGCGIGNNVFYLARDFDVVGIDISSVAI